MKRFLISAVFFFFSATTLHAQRQCGFDSQVQGLSELLPGFAETMAKEKSDLQTIADEYLESTKNFSNKPTATAAIPVIFHFVIDSTRLVSLGGVDGIRRRCDSQIAVLNRDYNKANSDSVLIPSGWKSLYASVGIRFGLAHTSPAGTSTPGYNIKITNQSFTIGATRDYGAVKNTDSGGLSGWDPEKYLNVWCLTFADNSRLLGLATPYSFSTGASGSLPVWHRGICLSYNAIGKREAISDNYASGVFDLGRTLTHECGHYFGLRHTWGDDGGACPWASSGSDDGIADTPPESNATTGNPTYDASLPNGTLFDGCKFNGSVLAQPIGIPCLDYMDYTDDRGMRLFTTQQAAVMAASTLAPSGANYPLTQNPILLDYPASVATLNSNLDFSIYPNPSDGAFEVQTNDASQNILAIAVYNAFGSKVFSSNEGIGRNIYSVHIPATKTGIYYVSCTFATGTMVQKILVQ